jgi:hypothetical protein
MTNFKPMGINSTPFISYHEINVSETDLLDDAWGFDPGFSDVIRFLGEYKPEPDDQLITSLFERIRDER